MCNIKEYYFTHDNKIKGIKLINKNNVWEKLYNNLDCSNNIKENLIDLLLKMLCYDKSQRITCDEALNHNLFKININC